MKASLIVALLLCIGCAQVTLQTGEVVKVFGDSKVEVREGDFLPDGSCPKCRYFVVDGGKFSGWQTIMAMVNFGFNLYSVGTR